MLQVHSYRRVYLVFFSHGMDTCDTNTCNMNEYQVYMRPGIYLVSYNITCAHEVSMFRVPQVDSYGALESANEDSPPVRELKQTSKREKGGTGDNMKRGHKQPRKVNVYVRCIYIALKIDYASSSIRWCYCCTRADESRWG